MYLLLANVSGSRFLHCPPEIICVKLAREFGVDVDNMHISLGRIADNSFVVFAGCWICFNVNAESAVELELQSEMSVSINLSLLQCQSREQGSCIERYVEMEEHVHCSIFTWSLNNTSLYALLFQFSCHTAKPSKILLQPLTLNLQITRLLRNLEFLRIQSQYLCCMICWIVLGQCVVVICAECLVCAVQGRERGLDGLQVLCAEGAEC